MLNDKRKSAREWEIYMCKRVEYRGKILAAIGQDVYHTEWDNKTRRQTSASLPFRWHFPCTSQYPVPTSHFPFPSTLRGRRLALTNGQCLTDDRPVSISSLDKFIFAFISIRRTFVKSCLRVCAASLPRWLPVKKWVRSNLADSFNFLAYP